MVVWEYLLAIHCAYLQYNSIVEYKKKMTVVILFKLSSRQLINTLKLLTKYTIRLVE